MKFGEKLQALRRAKGLSQEQLAEALGVTRQAISKWELNASLPDVEKLLALSEFFAVSTDYLLKESILSPTPPAAPESAPAPAPEPDDPRPPLNRAVIISGSIMAGLSAFGLLVVWILSRVYPAEYAEFNGMDESPTVYLSGFAGFVKTHDLTAMTSLCAILLVLGLGMVWYQFNRRYQLSKHIFAFIDRETND